MIQNVIYPRECSMCTWEEDMSCCFQKCPLSINWVYLVCCFPLFIFWLDICPVAWWGVKVPHYYFVTVNLLWFGCYHLPYVLRCSYVGYIVKSLSCVRLFETLWTVAHQAPPSIGFSRQEYWSGLPFPSPGDLPNPGIEPRSPAWQADALTSEPPGKPCWVHRYLQLFCLTLLYF